MEVKLGTRFPLLSSARTSLRQLTKHDAELIHFLRNDPQVNKFVDRPGTDSISDAAFFIEQRNLDFFHKKAIYWGIELNTTGFVIGSITLWHMDFESERAELGYDLHPAFQRKGYMSEAALQVINFGFEMLKFTEIIAITSPENIPSQALLESLGFTSMNKEDMPEEDVENGLLGYVKRAS